MKVVPKEEVQLRRDNKRSRDERLRELGRPVLMRNLAGAVATLNTASGAERARMAREAKSEQLRELLSHTITDLAIHDGPQAMIEFAFPLIKSFRSCGNE